MSSRIEQIIGEIEEYVDSCKFQPLSTTKIVVNKEEIEELLRELRLKTPDEIKRYQKIINNKDAILEDAQTKADALIADAQARAQELVTQHEIMQKAYAQANDTINAANKQAQEILDSATQDANSIRLSAITYTDDMMANIGSVLNTTLENLFSQIGNQTVKNTCCKECTDTLGNKIRQNAEVMVENTFCLSKDAQTAGCGGCSGQKYTSHVWQSGN